MYMHFLQKFFFMKDARVKYFGVILKIKILTLKKKYPFHNANLNQLYLKMICDKIMWNYSTLTPHNDWSLLIWPLWPLGPTYSDGIQASWSNVCTHNDVRLLRLKVVELSFPELRETNCIRIYKSIQLSEFRHFVNPSDILPSLN